MRSFRFLLSRRWFFFAIAVGLSAYACWWLGEWQFGRLHTRESTNAIIRTNEAAAPVDAATAMKPGTPVSTAHQWLRVTATGTYDAAHTITWRYLTNDRSQPGVDMVVPLVTKTGIVLVDRGWVGSDDSINLPKPAPAIPTGTVTVVGWLRQDGTGSSTSIGAANAGGTDDAYNTRALSSVAVSDTMGSLFGKPVLGGFVDLETENGAQPPGLTRVDLPELDDGPHFFYGLQWFFFGVLALFGFGYLAWEEKRTATDPVFAETMAARRRAHLERNQKKRAVKAAYQAAYDAEKKP